jgi:hypothetical protein
MRHLRGGTRTQSHYQSTVHDPKTHRDSERVRGHAFPRHMAYGNTSEHGTPPGAPDPAIRLPDNTPRRRIIGCLHLVAVASGFQQTTSSATHEDWDLTFGNPEEGS